MCPPSSSSLKVCIACGIFFPQIVVVEVLNRTICSALLPPPWKARTTGDGFWGSYFGGTCIRYTVPPIYLQGAGVVAGGEGDGRKGDGQQPSQGHGSTPRCGKGIKFSTSRSLWKTWREGVEYDQHG